MNEKHSGRRVLALIMAFALTLSLAVPASAAGNGNSRNQGSSSQNKGQSNKGQSNKGQSSNNQTNSSQTSSEDQVMLLVEDESTVEEDTELRASTYVLTTASAADAPTTYASATYTKVDGTTTIGTLVNSGETYYHLDNGTYYEVTITSKSSPASSSRKGGNSTANVTYTLTANNQPIASQKSASTTLDNAGVTLYTKSTTLDADDTTGTTETTGSTIKYFPVTMYNYDQDTINNATHQVEVASGETLTQWNGIYFSWGNPSSEAYSEELSIENGTYILQNARAAANNVGSWVVGDTSGITSTTNQSDATQWTIQKNSDGTYTLNSVNGYMTIGEGKDGEKTADTASNIEIVEYSGATYTGCVQLKSGSYYLCQWGGTNVTVYGGYNVNNDAGNAFYLYKVTDSGTELVTIETPTSLPYAAWNFWTGHLGGTANSNFGTTITGSNGNYLYSGLVESTLDANKNIVFTEPEGGIFNSDATVKTIYTNVELPFLYENGTYTFDASQNAVYFHEDSTQNSTTAKSNGRLYLNQGVTQSISDLDAEDGSTTVFMPFNDATAIGTTNDADYWFGMAATIPFTMTTNGRLNPNNDTSDPITFSFSGDDDVWVFIDGQLVIDLGGIHNRLDATIDFAANTVTYAENNDATGAMGDAADLLDVTATQTLFGGLISQDRTTFAATDSHELTIYYLERGAGSSNCKIQFNLPMKDSLSVKKLVSAKDSEGQTLDAETLAQINNRDFGFTLYKDGKAVANTNYSLLNENGQYISTPSTDANGHFTLKNGQTAKFVGVIDSNSYYVVEDKDTDADDFWNVPTWTYTAEVANGTTSTDSTTDGQSMTVTAKGSDEAEDSIVFTCTNTWKHQDKTSISAVDDKIVIDYGLPVIIDVLANDTVSNGTKSIESVTGAKYGTATINNGMIEYQLTEQLSDVEVLTYTVKATADSGVWDDNKTATANVYIIPATSMYYEENFSNMVTYTDNGTVSSWQKEGTAQTDPQEPGVVGTVDDSPYGSDAAYLNDSGDSNGTSMYLDTTDGYASFSYSFTGTGTSFFARTGATAAYMQVIVKASDGTEVDNLRRNNIYKAVDDTDVGTLYNIPVYTIDGLSYGTYTVKVTVMQAKESLNRGKDFYLDGIRVINPLFDPADETYNLDDLEQIAQTAYSTDGEANMTVATLRQKLIGEAQINEDDTISWNEGDNFVLFTDSNGAITSAEEYKSNGPKEEVYLNYDEDAKQGQSITFSLYDWDPNANKIYLGIKAPVGSGTASINGNTLSISNAADCYYEISGYATITTDDDGVKTATFKVEATSSLISVTNIKVTGNVQFTIVSQVDEEVDGDVDVDGDIAANSDFEDETLVTNPEKSEQPAASENDVSQDNGSGDGSAAGETETAEEDTTELPTEEPTELSGEEQPDGEENLE